MFCLSQLFESTVLIIRRISLTFSVITERYSHSTGTHSEQIHQIGEDKRYSTPSPDIDLIYIIHTT